MSNNFRENEKKIIYLNKIMDSSHVYVIYDVYATSIRGIFKTSKEATNSLNSLKDNEGSVIMKIPFGKTFDLIDELKMSKNPNYLSLEPKQVTSVLPYASPSKIDYKEYNLSGSSFLLISKLPEEFTPDFQELWELHPKEKGKVSVYGYRETPRWNASYLQNYNFSGQTLSPTTPLPQSIKKILDFVNLSEEVKYNQVLVNWYLDGSHYIGSHSDDERQLINNSNIFSLSLGSTRKFRMRDKKTREIVKDLNLSDGDIVVMGGTTQKEFKHEIVKIQGKKATGVGKRINITFRKFTDRSLLIVKRILEENNNGVVRKLADIVTTYSDIPIEVLSRIYRSFKK